MDVYKVICVAAKLLYNLDINEYVRRVRRSRSAR